MPMILNRPRTAAKTAGGSQPQAGVGKSAIGVDDVTRMVDERTANIADAAARATYIGTKMMDIPEAYRNQLPATADNGTLAAAEQKIREQYRKDMGVHVAYHQGYAGVAGHTAARGPSEDDVHTVMGRMQAEADQKFAAGDGNAGQPQAVQQQPAVNLDNMTVAQLFAAGLQQGGGAAVPASAGAVGPARPVQTASPPIVGLQSSSLPAAALIAMGLRGR